MFVITAACSFAIQFSAIGSPSIKVSLQWLHLSKSGRRMVCCWLNFLKPSASPSDLKKRYLFERDHFLFICSPFIKRSWCIFMKHHIYHLMVWTVWSFSNDLFMIFVWQQVENEHVKQESLFFSTDTSPKRTFTPPASQQHTMCVFGIWYTMSLPWN